MDKPSFEESLRVEAARRPRGGEHPSLADLMAYRAGELAAREEDHVQEHLTQCRDCALLLLDLVEFEQFPQPPIELPPPDARTAAAWQRLRPQLGGGEVAEPSGERSVPVEASVHELRPRPSRVPVWRRPALPWALAAGLARRSRAMSQTHGTMTARSGIVRRSAPAAPLYVSPRGLTTSAIPVGNESFDMEFDFIDHALMVRVSDGRTAGIDLREDLPDRTIRGLEDALFEAHRAHVLAEQKRSAELNAQPFDLTLPGSFNRYNQELFSPEMLKRTDTISSTAIQHHQH